MSDGGAMFNPINLWPFQAESVERLRAGVAAGKRRQILMSPTGSGKCLGRGTRVLMADGTIKPVERVASGDRLMGDDGTPRNVISVASGREGLYRVCPTKGDEYTVNASHLLSLRKTLGADGLVLADGSKVARDADIVSVRADVFAQSNRTARTSLKGWRCGGIENFDRLGPVDGLPIPPYILGAWLGDGSMHAPAAITKPGATGLVRRWREYAESFGYSLSVDQQPGKCPTWHIKSGSRGDGVNLVSLRLDDLRVRKERHIPADYLYASRNDRLELLAGLIDSDGSVSKGGCDWISKSQRLGEDFAFLCRSLGLACYLSRQRKGIKETGFYDWYWRASVSGDLSVVPTVDKVATPRKQKKRHLVHGVALKYLGEGDYFGFEIDGNKLFCLGDFTVTHNTEIASFLVSEAARKMKKVVFLVDRINLCDQTSARFDKYGISHGVKQANHWRDRTYERVQVCSAQTVERSGFPEMDLLIVDEAHCLRKATAARIAETNAVVLGLTATPFTKGLGKVYDSLVNVTTTNQLIADGYLCPLKMYAAKAVDMTGAKVVAGEWAESEIERRGTEIIGDIVSEWVDKTRLNFGGPVKTIVFSATVDHGEEICKRFQQAGFNFQQVSYRDASDQARRDLIEEFRKPDSVIHGLVSCEVFTKGFDVPDLLCGISARPYRKSLSSHIQQLGRVMRRAEGKSFGIWLDHSGNVLRFYKDTQEIFENGMQALDDGEHDAKARKEPEEKEKSEIACSCGFVLAPHHKVCPSCGKEVKRRSLVETRPGEMVEVSGLKAVKLPQWMHDRDGVWFQLCAWSAGRKSGDVEAARKLALAKYRNWYSEWPTRGIEFDPHREPQSLDLMRKIKADNIRWAKGQQAAARSFG